MSGGEERAVTAAERRTARAEDAWQAYSTMFEAIIDTLIAFVRRPNDSTELAFRDAAAGFRAAVKRRDTTTLEHVGELVAMRQLATLNMQDVVERLERLERQTGDLTTGTSLLEQRMSAVLDQLGHLSAQLSQLLTQAGAGERGDGGAS